MRDRTNSELEAITHIKDNHGGKSLITWLEDLLADEVEAALTVDPNNVGLHGRTQGSAMLAQELLHLLNADYVEEESENVNA